MYVVVSAAALYYLDIDLRDPGKSTVLSAS